MNTAQKNKVVQAIEQQIQALGSAARVAEKCQVNPAYISEMRSGKLTIVKDANWLQVAHALGVDFGDWVTVETTNSQIVRQVLTDAKQRAMFMAISHPAGSGKTAACRDFQAAQGHRGAYYYCVEHANMAKNDFLQRLCTSLGIDTTASGYQSANKLADQVIEFFVKRIDQRPLLVIDEADKLNDKALCFFISLYNKVEGKMGCVILGTENLRRKIETGVKWQKNGFDEIDSRFGRKFIHLVGARLDEVRKICTANGLTDPKKQQEIFEECAPESVMMGNQPVKIIRDLRSLRRKIEREVLLAAAPVPAPARSMAAVRGEVITITPSDVDRVLENTPAEGATK